MTVQKKNNSASSAEEEQNARSGGAVIIPISLQFCILTVLCSLKHNRPKQTGKDRDS